MCIRALSLARAPVVTYTDDTYARAGDAKMAGPEEADAQEQSGEVPWIGALAAVLVAAVVGGMYIRWKRGRASAVRRGSATTRGADGRGVNGSNGRVPSEGQEDVLGEVFADILRDMRTERGAGRQGARQEGAEAVTGSRLPAANRDVEQGRGGLEGGDAVCDQCQRSGFPTCIHR